MDHVTVIHLRSDRAAVDVTCLRTDLSAVSRPSRSHHVAVTCLMDHAAVTLVLTLKSSLAFFELKK